jgi:hypothetical protein
MIYIVCPKCGMPIAQGEDAAAVSHDEVMEHFKEFHPRNWRTITKRVKVKSFLVESEQNG